MKRISVLAMLISLSVAVGQAAGANAAPETPPAAQLADTTG